MIDYCIFCRAECGEFHASNGRTSDIERSTHNIMEASSDALAEMFLLLKGPANDLARQMVTSEQTTAIFMSSLEVCLRETRICSACQLDGTSEVRSNVKEARGHVQANYCMTWYWRF